MQWENVKPVNSYDHLKLYRIYARSNLISFYCAELGFMHCTVVSNFIAGSEYTVYMYCTCFCGELGLLSIPAYTVYPLREINVLPPVSAYWIILHSVYVFIVKIYVYICRIEEKTKGRLCLALYMSFAASHSEPEITNKQTRILFKTQKLYIVP